MSYYYALSILLSAFLLFQVQPMIGKYILPWFGGTPTVWSTVLLFFQALLTGGYAYAYWLLGRLKNRQQGIVHLALLGVSLVFLLVAALSWPSPLTPDAGWRPQGSELPIWAIFKVLAVSVGIPYLLLSSNSTLVQAWFSREEQAKVPYRLYALSNAGSLAALVSYPILFEPMLTLQAQAYLWSAAYVVFAITAALLALRTFRRAEDASDPESKSSPPAEATRPSRAVYLLWLGLAACATALLISVTSQITQEVAVIPFLWVLPLTIYLLTLILAFSSGQWYSRRVYLVAFFVVSAISVWMLVKFPPLDNIVQIIIYNLLLFVTCMLCHNELFKLRPNPRFLPSFYLMIALGGAIGGILATLLAQYLFTTGFWELQWVVIAGGVLVTLIMHREGVPVPHKQARRAKRQPAAAQQKTKPAVVASSVALSLLGISVLLIMQAVSSETRLATRNFYGVLRVWETNADSPKLRAYQLTHGKTAHGFQFDQPILRVLPTTYYAETSGVGLSILTHPSRPGPLRVGALGMGIGILAAYGEPGDLFRFYEINPEMIKIAQGRDGYFWYVRDSKAKVEVVEGDARISLERELAANGSQGFDLLVLDAFSGDAVPIHLLTKQAFDIYLQHVKQNGIVAVNVSNRYFKLDQVVHRLAEEFKLESVLIEDKGDGVQSYDSAWMLLARESGLLQAQDIATRVAQRSYGPSLSLWTDDYSNLLQIIK